MTQEEHIKKLEERVSVLAKFLIYLVDEGLLPDLDDDIGIRFGVFEYAITKPGTEDAQWWGVGVKLYRIKDWISEAAQ